MKRRILKGCGRDLAQNFIRASGERGFGRLRNFVSVGGARNFTLALAAICILGGCDGGSDGQSSTQNSAPQGLESKQNSDLNSTIDEFANDAKVLGEALQNLQKKAPEALNDFAARNADRIEDILKQGEAAAREAGKNLDKMGESL